jgi:hypothetical protein
MLIDHKIGKFQLSFVSTCVKYSWAQCVNLALFQLRNKKIVGRSNYNRLPHNYSVP